MSAEHMTDALLTVTEGGVFPLVLCGSEKDVSSSL